MVCRFRQRHRRCTTMADRSRRGQLRHAASPTEHWRDIVVDGVDEGARNDTATRLLATCCDITSIPSSRMTFFFVGMRNGVGRLCRRGISNVSSCLSARKKCSGDEDAIQRATTTLGNLRDWTRDRD